MVNEFIVIKAENKSYDLFIDIFRGIKSNLSYEYYKDLLVLDIEIDFEDLKGIILSLETELYTNITCFSSLGYFSDRKHEFLDIFYELITSLNNGIYNLKDLLLKNKVENKNEVLDFILFRSGVTLDFINSFAKNDLNASKVSKDLYMHRNTVLYKLEKLNEIAGFDLRSFIDLHILYNLIDK